MMPFILYFPIHQYMWCCFCDDLFTEAIVLNQVLNGMHSNQAGLLKLL